MGTAGKVIGGCAVAWFVVSGSALAQAPGDPDPGSPPGRVYELPVDTGRRDAAPRGGGNGDAGAPIISSFRSENNFGTSAVVPGDPSGGAGAGGADGADGGSGDGAGGGSDGGSGVELTSSALDTGDTSSAQNYLLLTLVVAGGILLGVTSSRVHAARTE